MGLPTIPLRYGLPSPRTPEGRAFAKQVLTWRVRIAGLRHPRLVAQLTTLLSLA